MEHGDVPVVIEIERRAYEFPWTEGIFHDCLRFGYEARVYETPLSVLGYCVFSIKVGECHFLNVCIDPRHQGQGHGRRLMEVLLEYVRARGAKVAFLEVRASNTAARRLYDGLGFNEIGLRRGYYPAHKGREDAVVLARDLGGR